MSTQEKVKGYGWLVVLALVLCFGLAAFAAQDGGDTLNVSPPSQIDKTVDTTHGPSSKVAVIGSVRLPVKSDYKTIFYQFTGLIATGTSRKVTAANYIMDNSTSIHPYPCQITVNSISLVASANTASAKVYFYNRGTYEGSGYATDTFAASVNFASIAAAPSGSDYIQDVQCSIPLINLDKTDTIPILIKNTGATASRFYLGITYQ
jgi:hypothetical protein